MINRQTRKQQINPGLITPPHAVRDREKLQQMVDAIRGGSDLPPVIVAQIDDDLFAITGSHRIAAARACMDIMDTIEAVVIDLSGVDIPLTSDRLDHLRRAAIDILGDDAPAELVDEL